MPSTMDASSRSCALISGAVWVRNRVVSCFGNTDLKAANVSSRPTSSLIPRALSIPPLTHTYRKKTFFHICSMKSACSRCVMRGKDAATVRTSRSYAAARSSRSRRSAAIAAVIVARISSAATCMAIVSTASLDLGATMRSAAVCVNASSHGTPWYLSAAQWYAARTGSSSMPASRHRRTTSTAVSRDRSSIVASRAPQLPKTGHGSAPSFLVRVREVRRSAAGVRPSS